MPATIIESTPGTLTRERQPVKFSFEIDQETGAFTRATAEAQIIFRINGTVVGFGGNQFVESPFANLSVGVRNAAQTILTALQAALDA